MNSDTNCRIVIRHDNQTLIDSKVLRCHDSRVDTFSMDFEHRSLTVVPTDSDFTNIRKIRFMDVIVCLMTGAEPWSHDCFIFDWQYLRDEEVKDLYALALHRCDKESMPDLSQMVCSEIVFKSGASIRVICGSVLVDRINH